jgi:hypothetical protein
MDGVDRCLHAFGNLLHIDIGGGCRSRVPKHTLHILYCALLLCERRNRSPDDPECQLRQLQILRQLVQHPFPVVAQLLAVLERLQSMFGVGRRDAHISRTGGRLIAVGLMAWMEISAMIVFLGVTWNVENTLSVGPRYRSTSNLTCAHCMCYFLPKTSLSSEVVCAAGSVRICFSS